MAIWTELDDATLRSMYPTHTRKQIAEALGRTEGAVRTRCCNLGLNTKKADEWTEEEVQALRDLYEQHKGWAVPLEEFAAKIGRLKSNVSRKARQLGLTERSRKRVEEWKPRAKHETDEQRKAAIREGIQRHLQENGHPRGMAGKAHTPEVREQMRNALEQWHSIATPSQKKKAMQKMVQTRIEKYGTGNPAALTVTNPYTRTKGGKREDLGGQFFRSAWEANYARYLNLLRQHGKIADWKYEPRTFLFEGVKRGPFTYTPDFLVIENDGREEYHEVKGWMDSASKGKIKRFRKYYPEITLRIIGKVEYNRVAANAGPLIPNWE